MKLFWKSNKNIWESKTQKDQYNALQEAVISDDINEIKERIKEGIDINTTEEYGQGNILMYYIQNADKRKYDPRKYVTAIIDLGIDVNHQRNGRLKNASALSYSVSFKNPDILEVLLENGAEVDIKDKNGNTPLWIAAGNYRGEVKALEIVKLLIDKGANLDEANNYGNSPRKIIIDRHRAVSEGGAMQNHPTAKSWDLIELI